MDCRNCGAPMKIGTDSDYLLCPYCDTIYFPETSRDGVRVLGEPAEVDCPVCGIGLASALIAQVPVLSCTRCRGILVRQRDLAGLVKNLRADPWGPEEMQAKPLNREHLKWQIKCPRCHRLMQTHPYYGPGNIVIDNCIDCGLAWLDYGEFYRIIHAPGRDRARGLSGKDE